MVNLGVSGHRFTLSQLKDDRVIVQSGGFIASRPSLEVETQKRGRAKTFFAREGLILLRVSGNGTLANVAHGAIEEIELGPGEKFIMDTDHPVRRNQNLKCLTPSPSSATHVTESMPISR